MRAAALVVLVLLFAGASLAVKPRPYQAGELVDFRIMRSSEQGGAPCTLLAIAVRDLLVHATQCPTFHWNAFNPAEFTVGGEVEVRFEGDFLILHRPNGKEIKARVMRRALRKAGDASLVSLADGGAVDAEQARE